MDRKTTLEIEIEDNYKRLADAKTEKERLAIHWEIINFRDEYVKLTGNEFHYRGVK